MKSELTSAEYENILLNIYPRLNQFTHRGGGEGEVYFIDDDYVVKVYNSKLSLEETIAFEQYVAENNSFNSLGFCIPKIYAWIALPQTKGNKIVVLQERAKGKPLYLDEIIEENYGLCSDFCSKQEFKKALANQEGALYTKIVQTFIGEFIKANQQLEALPDSEVENFIISDYGLLSGAQHCQTDIQAPNVMLADNKFTVIDNIFVAEDVERWTDEYNRAHVLKDIFVMFSDSDPFSDMYMHLGAKGLPAVSRLINKNKRVCGAALTKFVKKANQLLAPKITSQDDYDICEAATFDIISENDAKNILQQIDFEM